VYLLPGRARDEEKKSFMVIEKERLHSNKKFFVQDIINASSSASMDRQEQLDMAKMRA
jgi:hypothetical protein